MTLAQDYDCIVIGAGPAGMMAAGRAAERGKRVLLIEKNDIPGKKLLISGKGRCNITNNGSIEDHIQNFGNTRDFLRNAFAKIFNKELIEFFKKYGVPLKIKRGKRIFPQSGRSKDILDAMKRYLKDGKTNIFFSSEAKDIAIEKSGLKKVYVSKSKEFTAQSVAICTGGLSYPKTGSTGFGFDIAKKLGHNVIKPKPALVALVTESDAPRRLAGLSLENVEATVIADQKRYSKCFGDMLFTHFGLSGPIILDCSSLVYDLLQQDKDVHILINLKPGLDSEKLKARLLREFTETSNKTVKNVLSKMLPQRLVDVFADYCGIEKDKKAHQVKREERKSMIDCLSNFNFRIKATRSLDEAIVTSGGVDTKEINPKTMESKLIKGLFFAGEVIDVDAKTGGYNMQAAFSTGYLCGDNL